MSLLPVSVIGIVAWATLAFGAVFPVTYVTLLFACAIVGCTALLLAPSARQPAGVGPALTVLSISIGLQLVVVPGQWLQRISPAADDLLRQSSPAYASGALAEHSLSIDPGATALALLFLATLGCFLVGVAGALTRAQIRRIAEGIVMVGALVSMAALVQQAVASDKIYGVWTVSPSRAAAFGSLQPMPFGPFLNRNHFAGWALMTVSLTLGYFWGVVHTSFAGPPRGVRQAVRLLASPAANRAVLVAAAVAVIGLALAKTTSRSGITCLIVAVAIFVGVVAWQQMSRRSTTRAMTGAVLLVVFSLGLGGFDRILTRFTVETTGLGPRRGIWQDAMQVARRFPWTGSGLNTFRAAVAGSQTGHPGDRPTAAPAYRAAAHNDYLQLAAEGGVLVSVPAAILIVVFARAVRRRLRESVADPAIFWIRVGAVLGMTSIGLQELVDFSLQIPANAVLFTVLAALAIGGPAPSSSPAASPSRHGVLSST